MKRVMTLVMISILASVLAMSLVSAYTCANPIESADPSTPGAWIIYPDNTECWIGNDRYAFWGWNSCDRTTSIHNALGYSGTFNGPCGQNNELYWTWDPYNPPPAGSIIELRGAGQWYIFVLGTHCQTQLCLNTTNITLRGQDYNGQQQEIFIASDYTGVLLWAQESGITIENLKFKGNYNESGSNYAIAINRYSPTGQDPYATGLTVKDCSFENLRGVFDAGPGGGTTIVKDLTFIDNNVYFTYYPIFKKSVTFTGDNVMTGNTFTKIAEGQAVPAMTILDNTGSALIDNNHFDRWKTGQYAIKCGKTSGCFTSPISLAEGGNSFVDQLGGTGMAVNLDALPSGGYGTGLCCGGDYVPPGPTQVCGNGIVEGTEECDDGQCCTAECTLKVVGTPCDDGLYCNVGEVCNAGGECTGGDARDCRDSVSCTDDSCNEATDSCVNLPVDSNCAGFGTCYDATGYIWTGVCDVLQDCTRQLAPQEICDGIVDDDCDGVVDNGCACVNGQTQPCGPSTDVGACEIGTQTCVNGQWGECVGAVYPQPWDIPGNDVDEDCNGQAICPVPCVENLLTKDVECGARIGGWRTHGQYVSCVAHYRNDLLKAGLIDEANADTLVEIAAQSDIGMKTGSVAGKAIAESSGQGLLCRWFKWVC